MAMAVVVALLVLVLVLLLALPLSAGTIVVSGANDGGMLVATLDVRALLPSAKLLRTRRVQTIANALNVIAVRVALPRHPVVIRRVLAILRV
jgi:hypothetical protein